MYGLVSVVIVVFVVAFLILKIILRIRKASWHWLSVGVVCVLSSLFVALFFAIISDRAIRGFEQREVERVYLIDTGKVVTYGKDYVFIPIIGYKAKVLPIEGTDICSSNAEPFIIKYQSKSNWLFYNESVATKWQAYLPPGTLVAGNRIE